jgi:hypothetical protein
MIQSPWFYKKQRSSWFSKKKILQGITLRNLLFHRIFSKFVGQKNSLSRKFNDGCKETDVLNLLNISKIGLRMNEIRMSKDHYV